MFDRFVFQRMGVQGVLDAGRDAVVWNVGCHDDGARLRSTFPQHVLNTDIAVQAGYDYPVDLLFDAKERWPVDAGTRPGGFFDKAWRPDAAVLCDMLEHHYDHEIRAIFGEALKAGAERLVLTWPEDDYFWRDGLVGVSDNMGYRSHCNNISLQRMTTILKFSGYEVCSAMSGEQALEWGGKLNFVPSRGVLAAVPGREFSLGVDPLGGSL